ncbi:MAG: hypothetical protein LW713_07530 [Acetobacteraceae bacterium]|nr:hypothetical protein [Acetobacteraceae bacterium]
MKAPRAASVPLGRAECYVISTRMPFPNPLALSAGIAARLGLSALLAVLLWAGVAWALAT